MADQELGGSAPGPLWSLPILGGSPRRLGDAEGRDGAWSPDGKMLVYQNWGDLFLAKADGTESRKLVTMKKPVFLSAPVWSPDGTHLRFNAWENDFGPVSIWEVSVDGTGLHQLLSGWHNPPDECWGRWTPDGKYFVFQSKRQIWALPRKSSFLRTHAKPIQLTSSPQYLLSPLPSKDGKKLFVVGRTYHGELMRYDLKPGQFSPFLGGISAEYVAFSKDGQWVAYVSYPEGTLWRSKADGSERLQLTYPPNYAMLPRWSPDRKTIVFFEMIADRPDRIYEVSPEGGTPRLLMPDDPSSQGDPNWSPDGSKIVFGRVFNDPATAIRVLDLASQQVTTLPGSQGLFSPRWSPDGRYIVAQRADETRLLLFDFQTQKWTEIAKGGAGWQNWSKDGKYVYFLGGTGTYGVLRFRISDRKTEQVVDLKNFRTAGQFDGSLALAPDDSPLLLRDAGTSDVYALDWEEP